MKTTQKTEVKVSKWLVILLAILVALFVGWVMWAGMDNKPAKITNYEECVAAGNPVQESFPPVCVTPDGQRFTGN